MQGQAALVRATATDVADTVAGAYGLLTLSPDVDMGAGDFFDYSLSFVRVGAFSLQSYEIAGVDANGEQTVDPRLLSIAVSNDVPEPASWMLVGLGMALLRRKTGRPAAR